MERWISFHDSEFVHTKLAPGKVDVRVRYAQTGLTGGVEGETEERDAFLICDGVTKLLVDGYTDEHEYIFTLEYKVDPASPFRGLYASGTTRCAEVRIGLWPTGGEFRIWCSSATLGLVKD